MYYLVFEEIYNLFNKFCKAKMEVDPEHLDDLIKSLPLPQIQLKKTNLVSQIEFDIKC